MKRIRRRKIDTKFKMGDILRFKKESIYADKTTFPKEYNILKDIKIKIIDWENNNGCINYKYVHVHDDFKDKEWIMVSHIKEDEIVTTFELHPMYIRKDKIKKLISNIDDIHRS